MEEEGEGCRRGRRRRGGRRIGKKGLGLSGVEKDTFLSPSTFLSHMKHFSLSPELMITQQNNSS